MPRSRSWFKFCRVSWCIGASFCVFYYFLLFFSFVHYWLSIQSSIRRKYPHITTFLPSVSDGTPSLLQQQFVSVDDCHSVKFAKHNSNPSEFRSCHSHRCSLSPKGVCEFFFFFFNISSRFPSFWFWLVKMQFHWVRRRMGLRANSHKQFHCGDQTVGILVPVARCVVYWWGSVMFSQGRWRRSVAARETAGFSAIIRCARTKASMHVAKGNLEMQDLLQTSLINQWHMSVKFLFAVKRELWCSFQVFHRRLDSHTDFTPTQD